jgi:hypothetical protein
MSAALRSTRRYKSNSGSLVLLNILPLPEAKAEVPRALPPLL